MIDFQWIVVTLYIQLNAEIVFTKFMFHRICTTKTTGWKLKSFDVVLE